MARHINWAGVSHGDVDFTEVMDVQFDERNDIIRGKGDVAIFATRVDVVGIGRTARVVTEDPTVVAAIQAGDEATLTATHKAAGNGSALPEVGDLVFTMTNAVATRNPFGGRHAQYGQATVEFEAYSPDGVTDPLTVTVQAGGG